MHVTRPPGLSALAIVVPRPQLPNARSSVASSTSSPRTPRTPSCSSNTLFTTTTTNRNSTDSWNSSNAADDQEWEWKPEQVRLLSRTLDALPAHLVTPFNGPIPPSNLLDKIARGVAEAKGPIDWPHSLRATRVKLIELSRARAKEEQSLMAEVNSDLEMEEASDRYHGYPESAGKGISVKRPLYRQSSMDFMNAADLRDNENTACLSDRLQRTKNAYHPYSRRSRLSSPACSADVPSLISPSTPSSSTLNSLSSFSSANRILRRTSSNISSTSASSISFISSNGGAPLSDPRLQRIRRTESFCALTPPSKDIRLSPSFYKENLKDSPPTAGVKRAPSFSALAQESRRDRHVFGGAVNTNAGEHTKDATAYPSSDEEEKIRARGAKKMRVKDANGLAPAAAINTGTPPNSPPSGSSKKSKTKTPSVCQVCKSPTSPKSPTVKSKKRSGVTKDLPPNPDVKRTDDVAAATQERRKTRSPPMNLQRNPSMFGAELPHLSGSSTSPAPATERRSHSSPAHAARLASPPPEPVHIASPAASPTGSLGSPQKARTLRRVQRLAIGRRISFGSLVPPGEDADGEAEDEDEETRRLRRERLRQRELGQLGSAFQLH
ncbi:hypothetical protein LshimejAT787_0802380 [Lyophyllum shimeji]|uniref:Uncharacterized protein n=1 Tax=Lyophyllum shimeji TaxID=47721 RepID=A0A9P3PS43_LYOSH|nr:hypothetical protein LshimejAT787_0802380 [Lyophyllum shimeji]